MGPRNLAASPTLITEGELIKPLKVPENLLKDRTRGWSDGLSPFDRVHYHQTLASVRRYIHFKPLQDVIPKDSLDISLFAEYDHGVDQFGDKVDIVLQGSTMGTDNRRRMRNTMDIAKEHDAISAAFAEASSTIPLKRLGFEGSVFGSTNSPIYSTNKNYKKTKEVYRYNEHHILHVGGLKERRHPCNVKLMNSSHHSPQSNAGYSRQDSDGNSYQY